MLKILVSGFYLCTPPPRPLPDAFYKVVNQKWWEYFCNILTLIEFTVGFVYIAIACGQFLDIIHCIR